MKIRGKVFILSGPSGSGKTTLYKKLLQSSRLKGKIEKIISATTRQSRSGEVDGKDYFFLSPKMFAYKEKAGHFLEAQKVFDHHYGTPFKAVRDILGRSRHVLLCIDVQGARVVWQKFPDAVGIFIKTPSLEVLKQRLVARGSEGAATVRLRMETARLELQEAKYYRYVLVNQDLEICYSELENIVLQEMAA